MQMNGIECNIYYSNQFSFFLIVEKDKVIPHYYQYRFIGNPSDNDFRSIPISWHLVASQIITSGIPTERPIEGLRADKIIDQIKKYGCADDGDRRVDNSDTVLLEFLDYPNEKKSYTIVGNKKEATLSSLISKGHTVRADTPIGEAVLGAKINDTIEIEFPHKIRSATIKDIEKADLPLKDRLELLSKK